VGLRGAADTRIWDYAHVQGFAILSKDTDFRERSFLEGAPPKIIWLDVGNAATAVIIELLQREQPRVLAFGVQLESSVLILSIGHRAVGHAAAAGAVRAHQGESGRRGAARG
jgi:predicted nuclease of predicted toxin-antitoxin system